MSWNLPPGCTERDIDNRFGDVGRCAQCDEKFDTDDLDKDWLCEDCAEEIEEEEEEECFPPPTHTAPPFRGQHPVLRGHGGGTI